MDPIGPGQFIEASIPQRFRAQVRLAPDRTAIETDDRSLTYRELARAVDTAAAAMRRRCATPGGRIALLVDQGADAIIATLAALSAGAAYVPLDPGLPREVLADQLRSAEPSLVIAGRRYLRDARDAGAAAVPILCTEELDAPGEMPAAPTVSPDALAYIYFTSGSTGRPKGVCDSHRNVLHNVWRYTRNLKIDCSDRLTLLQAPHFSGAVSSMFCALLNGATSLPYDVRGRGLDGVGEWMRRRRVTLFHAVPAIFREVVVGGGFPALRCVRLEGDRASARDVELFQRWCEPRTVLANGLGATECGLVRQWRIDTATPIPAGPVPIGDPIDDMEIQLLDEDRQPVPAGEVGEIAVRSRYLALGYWRRPDLDAAKFLVDAADPTLRTYLTGDLGRMSEAGLLLYLGRADFLQKVRGQWVDVDAIERALGALPGVHDAVVALRERADGETRMVAYVVPSAEFAPRGGVASLRRELARRLAPAMLPRAWVLLGELPLNANLKVDRSALPEPADDAGDAPADTVASTDGLERTLQRVWCEVTGAPRIDVDDDLLVLGVDSLDMMRARARLVAALSVEMPLTLFFDQPTIAGQAAALRRVLAG